MFMLSDQVIAVPQILYVYINSHLLLQIAVCPVSYLEVFLKSLSADKFQIGHHVPKWILYIALCMENRILYPSVYIFSTIWE